ncbi:MAG: hypothetical protein AABX23_01400 [Nanoarchaeota archaeon]
MEQYRKTMITFGVLVIVLFGLYYFSDWFSRTTGYVLGDDEKTKLASCLGTKNAVFYTSSTCPDCEKQLELFGRDASKILNVVVCENAESCPEGGVPAWTIGKQTYYGLKNLDDLIKISGCDVN